MKMKQVSRLCVVSCCQMRNHCAVEGDHVSDRRAIRNDRGWPAYVVSADRSNAHLVVQGECSEIASPSIAKETHAVLELVGLLASELAFR